MQELQRKMNNDNFWLTISANIVRNQSSISNSRSVKDCDGEDGDESNSDDEEA